MAENGSSRRATSGRVGDLESTTKFFQDEMGMSPEKSRKAAKQLLDLIKEQRVEHSRIVASLSDIEKIQTRYLDDNVKLTNVLSEQSVETQQQIDLLREKISNAKDGSNIQKELQSQLKQQLEIQDKITEARAESVLNLNEEQKVEADLYQLAYKSQSEDEKRLRTLREEQKILNTQIKALKEKDKLTDKEKEKLKKLEKDKRDKTKEEKEVVSRRESSTFKGFIDDNSKLGKSISSAKESYSQTSDAIASKFEGALGKTMGKVAGAITSLGNIMEAGLNKLNNYVESAAKFLGDTKGAVNALLRSADGSQDIFSKFLSHSEEYLAAGTIITQQEYLSAIKQIASQGVGVSTGLETASLLTAVAEKTVPQFSATNEALRRLVKLGETNATQRFFGLESIILKSLNAQFGDTSYLNQLFDSVNQTMMDAVTNLSGDKGLAGSYDFRNTLQQWMSYLYEQGVDSNTINRITTSMNALGSGNVSAMSSDAGMQKLVLLSLDKAGQDFATVLQEGLSADMLNTIMSNMTDYLKNLVGKTEKNNVLESAYANLFGLSMTDLYAFGREGFKKPSITTSGTEGLEAETEKMLASSSDKAYTMLSEKIDNAITNMQFTFGQNIANSSLSYGIWKGANLAMDIGGAVGGVVGKGIELAGRVALVADAIPALAKTVYHTIAGGFNYLANDENSVQSLYKAVTRKSAPTGFATGIPMEDTSKQSDYEKGASKFKNFQQTGNLEGEAANMEKAQAKYEKEQQKLEDEGGESTKILKELEKTFMKNKEGQYAVAVSLENMDDEVLKSFASIFADEDSMENVFDTDEKKEKLFAYDGETTSSSDDGKDKDKSDGNGGNKDNKKTGNKKTGNKKHTSTPKKTKPNKKKKGDGNVDTRKEVKSLITGGGANSTVNFTK